MGPIVAQVWIQLSHKNDLFALLPLVGRYFVTHTQTRLNGLVDLCNAVLPGNNRSTQNESTV
jgi:hypothetical protein